MIRTASLLLAGLVAAAAPVAAAAQAPTPARAQDWSQRVEVTAEGGYRMGNPDAPVKLVEYASITCSHCADFNAAASQPLRNNHVRSGRVSWEVRPYLIFPSDPGITLLLQCQAPANFFTTSDELFATQEQWTQRITAQVERLKAMSDPRQQLLGVVRASGVDRLFKQKGMTEAQVASCLADETRWDGLSRLQANAEAAGVQGTPTFFINGTQVAAGNWEQLEPLLAGASPG